MCLWCVCEYPHSAVPSVYLFLLDKSWEGISYFRCVVYPPSVYAPGIHSYMAVPGTYFTRQQRTETLKALSLSTVNVKFANSRLQFPRCSLGFSESHLPPSTIQVSSWWILFSKYKGWVTVVDFLRHQCYMFSPSIMQGGTNLPRGQKSCINIQTNKFQQV